TSCPLCHFNLDERQRDMQRDMKEGFEEMPILYFTQVLAIALGLGEEVCNFDIHFVDPRPLFREE
ncbi:unnamed protein product, partial [marine sediment metagenome]